jgi:RNA polymerase sigma-70 factor (ECF subfamily)
MAAAPHDARRSDEELMRDLARGQQEALGPLYSRYASLVFHLGVQSLDRPAAEELVQEVFLTIWRGAGSFDATQGAFKPWLLRLTHWKILNELRRRRRRPPTAEGQDEAEEDRLQAVVDLQPGPEEQAWQTDNENIVKAALEALPPKQRQAIALAFIEDMTHEQVARTLDVPLGTAKTRIRSGLRIMRGYLAPMAASLLGLALAIVGFKFVQNQVALDRDERALDQVTTSDLVPLRLTPVTDSVPAGAHANYRGRPGSNLAVLTTELLPPAPAGETYQAWARHGDQWTSLGTFAPNADGVARVIAENPALATTPDQVEITLERGSGSQSPTGQAILSWAGG